MSILRHLAPQILALSRTSKRSIVLLLDMALCVLSVWIAFCLRLGELSSISSQLLSAISISILIALPLFAISGLYQAVFRYNGLTAMMTLVRALLLYTLAFVIIFTFHGVQDVPRTIGLIQPLLLLLLVGASRVVARILLSKTYGKNFNADNSPRALIYGAGSAGQELASALIKSGEIKILGFLDDDRNLTGHRINGLLIYKPSDLEKILAKHSITEILLALPSVSRRKRKDIVDFLKNYKVAVRTLPSLSELAIGNISFSDIRNLDIGDLLGRDPVEPDNLLLKKNISRKVVLVTGAGGSIGSELCRQILAINPKKLLLVDHSEFALYSIYEELETKFPDQKEVLVPLLASIKDRRRLEHIFSTWHPDTIYQAAAYKHVPLVEHNPAEGIKNNVFGTLMIAQVALEFNVSDFVLISTDKAVRPTNVMGASKRIAELILQALSAKKSKTKFSMVRFGNVLDSSGSVVPKFRQQILSGGPITLTHLEITRYFMTISEAAQLVIQAGAIAKGGDVFVLDMGEPIKIIDLAKRMIELSGLTVKNECNPFGDIEIKVTGLRPGEKLYEEVLIGNNPEPTVHPKIIKAYENSIPWTEIAEILKKLEFAVEGGDMNVVIQIVCQLVPEYTSQHLNVDFIHTGEL